MQSWTYPATFERLDGEIVVRFPDVPEALTGAEDEAEARELAADALAVALDHYLDTGRDLPVPRQAVAGEVAIALAPDVAARAMLLRAMKEQHVNKVALAARMGRDEKVARRIVAGKGVSLDLTLAALKAVGLRPSLAV